MTDHFSFANTPNPVERLQRAFADYITIHDQFMSSEKKTPEDLRALHATLKRVIVTIDPMFTSLELRRIVVAAGKGDVLDDISAKYHIMKSAMLLVYFEIVDAAADIIGAEK